MAAVELAAMERADLRVHKAVVISLCSLGDLESQVLQHLLEVRARNVPRRLTEPLENFLEREGRGH